MLRLMLMLAMLSDDLEQWYQDVDDPRRCDASSIESTWLHVFFPVV